MPTDVRKNTIGRNRKDIPVGYLMLIPICITVETHKGTVSKFIPVQEGLFRLNCNIFWESVGGFLKTKPSTLARESTVVMVHDVVIVHEVNHSYDFLMHHSTGSSIVYFSFLKQ